MRFHFHQPSAADKLLENADRMKIDVMRIKGRLVAEIEIHCHVNDFHEDDDNGEPLPDVDTIGEIRDVLALFAAKVEGGGA